MTFSCVSFNHSLLWIQGKRPVPGYPFCYRLERCADKPLSHICGDTWLKNNNRLLPSYQNPLGVRCGLRDGDTISLWKYTKFEPQHISKPNEKRSDSETEALKEECSEPAHPLKVDLPDSNPASTELNWQEFNDDILPEEGQLFHFQLEDCKKPHSCGMASRNKDDEVTISDLTCDQELESFKIDPSKIFSVFKNWAYVKL